MRKMTLRDVLSQADTYSRDDEMVVLMKTPWDIESSCVVLPAANIREADKNDFTYFLEIALIREIIHDYKNRQLGIDELCSRIIFYAENDAYMD